MTSGSTDLHHDFALYFTYQDKLRHTRTHTRRNCSYSHRHRLIQPSINYLTNIVTERKTDTHMYLHMNLRTLTHLHSEYFLKWCFQDILVRYVLLPLHTPTHRLTLAYNYWTSIIFLNFSPK